MMIAVVVLISFLGGTLFGMITTALMTNSKINDIYDQAGRLQTIKRDEEQ